MKKKIIGSFGALVLLFGLTGCVNTDADNTTVEPSQSVEETTEATITVEGSGEASDVTITVIPKDGEPTQTTEKNVELPYETSVEVSEGDELTVSAQKAEGNGEIESTIETDGGEVSTDAGEGEYALTENTLEVK